MFYVGKGKARGETSGGKSYQGARRTVAKRTTRRRGSRRCQKDAGVGIFILGEAPPPRETQDATMSWRGGSMYTHSREGVGIAFDGSRGGNSWRRDPGRALECDDLARKMTLNKNVHQNWVKKDVHQNPKIPLLFSVSFFFF